jgi:Zn-dependent protease/CBS domain-containing protein
MNTSVPLGRFLGTEVRAHWSWVVILAFVTAVFALELGAPVDPPAGWSPIWAWGTAIGVAAFVFVSVAMHELAHVLVAYRNGMRNPAVVIQLIGGAFAMEVRPKTPGEEFRVAVAGSVVSFVLAALFGGLTLFLQYGPFGLEGAPIPVLTVEFVALMVCLFNVFLGLVNLIPGYPMDGARVAHAIVWRATGDDAIATAASVRLGRYVGFALMGTGVLVVFTVDQLAGLTLSIGGWLMVGSSRMLDRRGLLQELISGVRVADAVDTEMGRIPPQLTLDVFAAEFLSERAGSAAVVERGSEAIGLIGTAQIRRIPRRAWSTTHTEQAMVPIADVPVVAADSDLWAALELLERAGLDALVVRPAEVVAGVGVSEAADSDADIQAENGAESPAGPILVTRRVAARLVHARAEERRRSMMAEGIVRKGPFGGR